MVSTSESTVERGVVAGYDGSDGARFATLWAAAEAASLARDLLVVAVIAAPEPAQRSGEPTLREHAAAKLADVAELCRGLSPSLEVRTRVATGRPGRVLAELGDAAEMLVLGSSGVTGLSRLVLGSTAAELVHGYRRPIVVVRGEPANDGSVVVGVDGSDTSARAIEFAFDFADRHGRTLTAVHAWADLPMDALAPVRMWDYDWRESRGLAERLVAESLAGAQSRHPSVTVRSEVTLDRPVRTLLEHAEDAALLVVGSHGRGAIRGALLGSVSHAMIYHAPCPVAVLRDDSVGREHA